MKINVSAESDIAEGQIIELEHESKPYIIVRYEGNIYAYVNICSHLERVMNGCSLQEGSLVCPHHAVSYHADSGNVDNDMGRMGLRPLQKVKVMVVEGTVLLEVDN